MKNKKDRKIKAQPQKGKKVTVKSSAGKTDKESKRTAI
jgi:hypothetical protein